MATKLCSVVTYNEALPLIKLYDPSIMWFSEFMSQIEYYVSPLILDQWSPNMAKS